MRRYTDEDIIIGVAQTKSMAQLLRLLGLQPTGGNYDNMKRNMQRLQLSADHCSIAKRTKARLS